MLKTLGIHHVTAMTSDAQKIYEFMTEVLGLRLAKKTVNQDDIHTYHLFFTDYLGSPSTDMTFFDFPNNRQHEHGTDSISKTTFRVASYEALEYFQSRFDMMDITHDPISKVADFHYLNFEDFDGQRYALVSDEDVETDLITLPREDVDIPKPYRILGLGPVYLSVSSIETMHHVMTHWMGFELKHQDQETYVYQTFRGGHDGRIIVIHEKGKRAILGDGGVHHVAFRVEDGEALHQWIQHLNQIPARHSGYVDRFYFHSLYTRLYPGILFEFATDGPGFIDDEEDLEKLGSTLALPPKFRDRRHQIEALVKPLNIGKKQ
jgi:glyoxalase family protein